MGGKLRDYLETFGNKKWLYLHSCLTSCSRSNQSVELTSIFIKYIMLIADWSWRGNVLHEHNPTERRGEKEQSLCWVLLLNSQFNHTGAQWVSHSQGCWGFSLLTPQHSQTHHIEYIWHFFIYILIWMAKISCIWSFTTKSNVQHYSKGRTWTLLYVKAATSATINDSEETRRNRTPARIPYKIA